MASKYSRSKTVSNSLTDERLPLTAVAPGAQVNMSDKNQKTDDVKFGIGAIVRHRLYPFRGVVVDVDPEFDNTDEWYESIPAEVRPDKEQPFYHLLAENSDSYYTAYVSQQNLILDGDNGPVDHPDVEEMFDGIEGDNYMLRPGSYN